MSVLAHGGPSVVSGTVGREKGLILMRAGSTIPRTFRDFAFAVTAWTLRTRGSTRPVVALSALAMKGDERKRLEAGCDAYLTKPVDRRTLIALIARLVDAPADPSTRAPTVQGGPS